MKNKWLSFLKAACNLSFRKVSHKREMEIFFSTSDVTDDLAGDCESKWYRVCRHIERLYFNNTFLNCPGFNCPIVENVDQIMEIVESHRLVSTVSIAQKLNSARKFILNHLSNAG